MKSIITLICLLTVQLVLAQSVAQTKQNYLSEIIHFLAADSLKGRAAGTAEETIAADYIVTQFKANKNCKVKRQKFQFMKDGVDYSSQNIMAFSNHKSDKTILITAHYDHIGMGGELSHSKGLNEVHNGADDNASGVALMLSLAKKLSTKKRPYNYLFVAYSGHELGLYGSEYFAKTKNRKLKKVALTINFDMVGRLNTEKRLYFDCSSALIKGIENSNSAKVQPIKSVTDRLNTLDSKWFSEKKVQSVTFSTGKHIDYHKVTDDAEYINLEGIVLIEAFLLSWIDNIEL